MIVMCPIGNGSQGCTSGKGIGSGKHAHQGDESAIRTAINADALWINSKIFNQVTRGIQVVRKILSTHIPVNSGPPIPAVASTAPIINIKYVISVIGEQVIEHVFPEITAPPLMGIL